MAIAKTSVSLPEWVLTLARKHAETSNISLSALVQRGILREIAASHNQEARASVYGTAAVTGQENDERATGEDIRQASRRHDEGGAAA
ncbi:hypothetical protein GCM10010156_76410 [Planobispora rosea]|uniref:Uncharacterized protein n=1 Tax=Planobispora rosea TaxID=35762 RepID=A0A8J3WH61_PLARO|nr:hypothetical protein [Planobispora rosea]GGT08016.1 hypothetical protein GCM10010156_76410 [Planobispora rosea]GIH89178.1 hypothetical protein Pro02_75860 [Planobispora rosea]